MCQVELRAPGMENDCGKVLLYKLAMEGLLVSDVWVETWRRWEGKSCGSWRKEDRRTQHLLSGRGNSSSLSWALRRGFAQSVRWAQCGTGVWHKNAGVKSTGGRSQLKRRWGWKCGVVHVTGTFQAEVTQVLVGDTVEVTSLKSFLTWKFYLQYVYNLCAFNLPIRLFLHHPWVFCSIFILYSFNKFWAHKIMTSRIKLPGLYSGSITNWVTLTKLLHCSLCLNFCNNRDNNTYVMGCMKIK